MPSGNPGLGYIMGDFFKNSLVVDVIITIFCDFRQIWTKNVVFLKKQRYDQFFFNLALFCVKNANFLAKIF
jgi:hypothetical protein